MANVITNPDFSLVDVNGAALGWTRLWTFEPKLAIPSGSDLGPDEAGQGSSGLSDVEYDPTRGFGQGRYSIFSEGRMLSAYGDPGLIYTDAGFGANPGDVWHLSFEYQYAAPHFGEFPAIISPAENHDIFVRYGVTLWNDATQHWDAFYTELPIQTIVLPADLHNDNGPVQSYDYTFTIPANFPSSRLQFAICHTSNGHDLGYWETTINPTGWQMAVGIANVFLERVSVGTAGGVGSSPEDSFWHFYPTPRYASGYPIASTVQLEWDQWEIDSRWPPQIIYSSTNPDRPQPMPQPGIYAEELGQQDIAFFGSDHWFTELATLGGPESGNIVADGYTVNMPPTDTLLPVGDDPTIIQWRGLFQSPFSTDCGPHVAMLFGLRYLIVGPQVILIRNFFGVIQHPAAPGAVVNFMHPYFRGGAISTFGENLTWLTDPPPDQFSYDPCAAAGIHIWRKH